MLNDTALIPPSFSGLPALDDCNTGCDTDSTHANVLAYLTVMRLHTQFSSGGGEQRHAGETNDQQPSHEPRESPSEAEPPPSWLNRTLPASWLPYAHLMRLDKPIGEICPRLCSYTPLLIIIGSFAVPLSLSCCHLLVTEGTPALGSSQESFSEVGTACLIKLHGCH